MTKLYQPHRAWVVWAEEKAMCGCARLVFDCAICGDHMVARVHRGWLSGARGKTEAAATKKKVIRAFIEVHRHPDQQDPATWAKRPIHPSWTPEAEERFAPSHLQLVKECLT